MATKAQGVKGNPAGKRMQNANLKARRARSWARGQVRKAANIERARIAFEMNEAFRAIGEPTPYELHRRGQQIVYEALKVRN